MKNLYRTSWNSLISVRGERALLDHYLIDGVFLENPETYDYENEVVVRLTDPTFTIHEEDLKESTSLEGLPLFIRGKQFKIREQNPQGHGRIELRLVSGKS